MNVQEIVSDKIESLKEEYNHISEKLKEYDAYTQDEYELECNEEMKIKAKIDVLEEILVVIKKVEEVKVCPKCGREYIETPAISREDNKTEICSVCGALEAIKAYYDYLNSKDKKEDEENK